MKKLSLRSFAAAVLVAAFSSGGLCADGNGSMAADAGNALGVDLFQRIAKDGRGGNLLISPYSISSALAMTFAGADGGTRNEMARVLHLPKDADAIHPEMAALAGQLDRAATKGNTLAVANRLFGQKGFPFRAEFMGLVEKNYGAPLEPLDFGTAPEAARKHINGWVEERTKKYIRDLIPAGGIDGLTRLVLVNALYFRGTWELKFPAEATVDKPFFVDGTTPRRVPTMTQTASFGFRRCAGFTAVTLPYAGGELQMLLLVPDVKFGVDSLIPRLTPKLLGSCGKLPECETELHLPKFKFAPETMLLNKPLTALGLKQAFDISANFNRMSPASGLYVNKVFHKTFIEVDEAGTKAGAATAAGEAFGDAPPKIEIVRVNRPFLFAIQHRATGACLFLGRVTDPTAPAK